MRTFIEHQLNINKYDMILTNKERAKLVVLLKIEQLTTLHREEDYIHHLGYLVNKYLSPILGNLGSSGGDIPNPKRMLTIKRRIVTMYERAIYETSDDKMKKIYTNIMINTQKKIDKTSNKIIDSLGNMNFPSYLY